LFEQYKINQNLKEIKMVTNEKIITIKRPINDVFAYVSSMENGPKWQPELSEVQRITKGPVKIGSQFSSARIIMGQKMVTIIEFVAFEPNSKYTIKSVSGGLPFEQTTLFESTAEGTKLTTKIELYPSGDMTQAEPMLAETLKREMETDFDGLKKLLERKATPVLS
jgi:uncharacterized protein YndB with AHSA1/START domain